jgi:hypothetical protein
VLVLPPDELEELDELLLLLLLPDDELPELLLDEPELLLLKIFLRIFPELLLLFELLLFLGPL